jgi:phosphoribosylformylglycinamidine synthase subunit PurS
MRFLVRIRIMPRQGILDPQGQAVAHALDALGFSGVADARVGRSIEYALEAADAASARDAACRMCERLLANPVTEDFTIDAVEPAA